MGNAASLRYHSPGSWESLLEVSALPIGKVSPLLRRQLSRDVHSRSCGVTASQLETTGRLTTDVKTKANQDLLKTAILQ